MNNAWYGSETLKRAALKTIRVVKPVGNCVSLCRRYEIDVLRHSVLLSLIEGEGSHYAAVAELYGLPVYVVRFIATAERCYKVYGDVNTGLAVDSGTVNTFVAKLLAAIPVGADLTSVEFRMYEWFFKQSDLCHVPEELQQDADAMLGLLRRLGDGRTVSYKRVVDTSNRLMQNASVIGNFASVDLLAAYPNFCIAPYDPFLTKVGYYGEMGSTQGKQKQIRDAFIKACRSSPRPGTPVTHKVRTAMAVLKGKTAAAVLAKS